MRCASCKTTAIRKLPPNQFSRRPGYICSECGTAMREPDSTGSLIFVITLGGFVALLGVVLCLVAVSAEEFSGRLIGGAVAVMALGASVAGWAVSQLRLPVPLDAPPRPSFLSLWILLFLLVLLIIGAGMFGFAYFLHEMM